MVSREGVQGSANNVASSTGPAESDDSGGETWHVTRSIVERALTQPSEARRVAACVAISGIQTENALGATTASAQTLLLAARFQSLIGAHVEGVGLAVRAVRLSDQLRDAALAQQALSLAGELLAESGAVADGLIHAVAGLDISVELAEPEAGSDAWCALAGALLATGQTQSALVAAGHALTLARLSAVPIFETRAMCHSALASLYLDDINGVLRMAHQCTTRLDSAATLEEQVLRAQAEHHYARALARSGRLGLARQRAELAQRHALASGSAVAHAYATVALAMCDAAEGAHERASSRLQGALAQSVPQIVLPAMHALIEAARRSGDRTLLVATRRKLYTETRTRQLRAAELQAELARHSVATRPGQIAFGGTTWLETRAAAAVAAADPLDRLEETATAVAAGEHPSGVLRLYRCGRVAAMLGADLGWPEAVQQSLERAARLHAIGKLYVPPEVTAKPGPLTAGERSMIQNSYALGAELLTAAGLREQPILWDVVQCVSEHWDGTGPRQLAGEVIPHAARIVAIAAAYVSLTSGRPFRGALSHEEAVAGLRADAGSRFDPVLTERAISLLSSAQARVGELQGTLTQVASGNRFVQVRGRLADLLGTGSDGT